MIRSIVHPTEVAGRMRDEIDRELFRMVARLCVSDLEWLKNLKQDKIF